MALNYTSQLSLDTIYKTEIILETSFFFRQGLSRQPGFLFIFTACGLELSLVLLVDICWMNIYNQRDFHWGSEVRLII